MAIVPHLKQRFSFLLCSDVDPDMVPIPISSSLSTSLSVEYIEHMLILEI